MIKLLRNSLMPYLDQQGSKKKKILSFSLKTLLMHPKAIWNEKRIIIWTRKKILSRWSHLIILNHIMVQLVHHLIWTQNLRRLCQLLCRAIFSTWKTKSLMSHYNTQFVKQLALLQKRHYSWKTSETRTQKQVRKSIPSSPNFNWI